MNRQIVRWPSEVLHVVHGVENKDVLDGVDFSNIDLSGASLSWVSFQECSFDKTNLSGACLHHADFSGADLREADLSDANLYMIKTSPTTLINWWSTNLVGRILEASINPVGGPFFPQCLASYIKSYASCCVPFWSNIAYYIDAAPEVPNDVVFWLVDTMKQYDVDENPAPEEFRIIEKYAATLLC